jgi:hypothetical protein
MATIKRTAASRNPNDLLEAVFCTHTLLWIQGLMAAIDTRKVDVAGQCLP